MSSEHLIFAGDMPSQTISNRVRRGELRQIVRSVYTDDTVTDLDKLVRSAWPTIVGRLYPTAVITDRSATTGGPVEGYLYLAHPARSRETELPGLTVIARPGAGPLDGDFPIPGGLHLASRPRALVENLRASRARRGRPPRTLTANETADWVNRLCQIDGEEKLLRYRSDAERFSALLGADPDSLAALGKTIGAALQTHKTSTTSRALDARQHGHPYDPDRVRRFDLLVQALRSAAPQFRRGLPTDSEGFRVQAFYESYFSNYIEGTEFTVDEARQIVDDHNVPNGRHADGHDITATFRLAADPTVAGATAANYDDFVTLMFDRHSRLMAARPDKNPGEFKTVGNQAGNTTFVAPDLVRGTLRAGFERLPLLDSAWERSVYTMFVVAEVHPFTDGNGRVARLMMNAELVAANESKLIVPIGGRNDYLDALRRLSRDDDPSQLIKVCRFLQDHTFQIHWGSRSVAQAELESTYGFSDEREDGFRRLRLLRPVDDVMLPERSSPVQPIAAQFVRPYVRDGRFVSGYQKPTR